MTAGISWALFSLIKFETAVLHIITSQAGINPPFSLGTNLWEIRILGKDNIRAIYALIYNNQILIVHGFIKKSQKTPVKDINLSLARYKDWEKRNS